MPNHPLDRLCLGFPTCECVASSQTRVPSCPRSAAFAGPSIAISRLRVSRASTSPGERGAKHKVAGIARSFHKLSVGYRKTLVTPREPRREAAGKVINTGNELSYTALRNTASRSWNAPRPQSHCSGTRRCRFHSRARGSRFQALQKAPGALPEL
jgi:hypothetical protein